mgnify:FL=1
MATYFFVPHVLQLDLVRLVAERCPGLAATKISEQVKEACELD